MKMEGNEYNVLSQCNEINRYSGNDNDDKKKKNPQGNSQR